MVLHSQELGVDRESSSQSHFVPPHTVFELRVLLRELKRSGPFSWLKSGLKRRL